MSTTGGAHPERSAHDVLRALVVDHWTASAAGDLEREHQIYAEDVICDYPQSGERIRGRQNIYNVRANNPGKPSGFKVRRIMGNGNLWVTEYIINYLSGPAYTVSIMEFLDDQVVHETQYYTDPFEAPASRKQWVETMPR